VAEHLDIPYYVVNFERKFEEKVVRPFIEDYLDGRTPVPCTLCNNWIKFEELLVLGRQLGAEKLATGHYARIRYDSGTGRHQLLRAVDESKDQSYFLFGLTQEQLAETMFPLGELTKEEVREVARELGVPVAEKPESQEICFVPTGDYVKFIEAYLAEEANGKLAAESGEVVTKNGEVVASHSGVHQFTIGQRKGLGVAVGQPLYVISVDAAAGRVTIGEEKELYKESCVVRQVNWLSMAPPTVPVRVETKIRHKHDPARAKVIPLEGRRARIVFESAQRAITPGQAAVFYDGEIVLGGGWIQTVPA
jgi:tRNA-specific 2-thiouridylase